MLTRVNAFSTVRLIAPGSRLLMVLMRCDCRYFVLHMVLFRPHHDRLHINCVRQVLHPARRGRAHFTYIAVMPPVRVMRVAAYTLGPRT